MRCRSLVWSVITGWLTGYLAFAVANTWMHWTISGLLQTENDLLATVTTQLIILLHGGLFGVFGLLWCTLRKRSGSHWFLAGAIWTLLEVCWPMVYPFHIGCWLLGFLPLAQLASLGGGLLVSTQTFLIAALVPMAAQMIFRQPIQSKQWFAPTLILLLTTSTGLWGSWALSQATRQVESEASSNKTVRIGLVQQDTEVASFHVDLQASSRTLLEQDVDLLVWPECSIGKYNKRLTSFRDENEIWDNSLEIQFQAKPFPAANCHLLAGGHSWISSNKTYVVNSESTIEENVKEIFVTAFLIDPEETIEGRHDKMELMAGGEYLPLEQILPFLGDWFRDDESGLPPLSRGVEAAPVGDVNGFQVGALLCCEDMYAKVAKAEVNQGADVLVCLCNAMAFNSEIPLFQHLNLARFRAVENRRPLVRCGSHGVSCIVSPTGEISDRLTCFEPGTMVCDLPLTNAGSTFFGRNGYLLLWIYAGVAVFHFCVGYDSLGNRD